MPECGCGSAAAPSFNNFFIAIAQFDSAVRLIPTVNTYGKPRTHIIQSSTIYSFLDQVCSAVIDNYNNVGVFYFYRKYLPVLKNFPNNYIHEPWMAPESVQKAAKCIIGEDYPKPMINHAIASKINMERMRQAYSQLARYKIGGSRKDLTTMDDVSPTSMLHATERFA